MSPLVVLFGVVMNGTNIYEIYLHPFNGCLVLPTLNSVSNKIFVHNKGGNMQKWEYKFIRWELNPIRRETEGVTLIIGFDENDTWTEDDKELFTQVDMTQKINQLGKDGWELVAIVPKSTLASSTTSGLTSEILWVFKRPVKKQA
jgi:hypothetical protein